MDKMSKTAKLLDRICRFLFWALMIGTVVILLGATFLTITWLRGGTLLKANQMYLLSFGKLELMLAPGVLAEVVNPGFEPWLLGLALLVLGSLILYFLMVLTVQDILKPFIERTPFQETVAKDLKRLSIPERRDFRRTDRHRWTCKFGARCCPLPFRC